MHCCTYGLSDCGLADLVRFIEDLPMQVIQNGCRVTDTGKVHHGLDVPETHPNTHRCNTTVGAVPSFELFNSQTFSFLGIYKDRWSDWAPEKAFGGQNTVF